MLASGRVKGHLRQLRHVQGCPVAHGSQYDLCPVEWTLRSQPYRYRTGPSESTKSSTHAATSRRCIVSYRGSHCRDSAGKQMNKHLTFCSLTVRSQTMGAKGAQVTVVHPQVSLLTVKRTGYALPWLSKCHCTMRVQTWNGRGFQGTVDTEEGCRTRFTVRSSPCNLPHVSSHDAGGDLPHQMTLFTRDRGVEGQARRHLRSTDHCCTETDRPAAGTIWPWVGWASQACRIPK